MSIPILDLAAENFIHLFGSAQMVAIVFIGMILVLLLAARVGKVGILMIIVPFMITLAGVGASQYIAIAGKYDWIIPVTFLMMGAIFAGIFITITR